MKLRKIEMMRFYGVSEVANEDGLYDPLPLDGKDADFNEEFEKECLDEVLDAMVARFFGDGSYIEINEDSDYEVCGDAVRISIGDDCVEIPINPDKINCAPDDLVYLLVDKALEDACWIVVERCVS